MSLTSHHCFSRVHLGFVSGGLAFVAADGSGLRIVDVTDPTALVEVGFVSTPANASGVYVSGGLAFVAGDRSGLHIMDVSDPSSPVEVSSLDTLGSALDVFVSGELAFVVGSGLHIVDVSDPAAPVEVGTLEVSSAGLRVPTRPNDRPKSSRFPRLLWNRAGAPRHRQRHRVGLENEERL